MWWRRTPDGHHVRHDKARTLLSGVCAGQRARWLLRAGQMLSRCVRVVLAGCVAGCGVGLVDGSEDSYWDESSEDTGAPTDALRAGNKRVALDPGKTTDAELVETLPVARSEN